MNYPFYDLVSCSESILQGDLILECPIIKPPTTFDIEETPEIEISFLNVVVLSQSCDLENRKIDIVLVSPYYTLDYYLSQLPSDQQNSKGRPKAIQDLLQGNRPSYHLLSKDEKVGDQALVVDFKNVYGVSFEYLEQYVKKIDSRARILPPFREHLSQAFARYFMRVGLPSQIQY